MDMSEEQWEEAVDNQLQVPYTVEQMEEVRTIFEDFWSTPECREFTESIASDASIPAKALMTMTRDMFLSRSISPLMAQITPDPNGQLEHLKDHRDRPLYGISMERWRRSMEFGAIIGYYCGIQKGMLDRLDRLWTDDA